MPTADGPGPRAALAKLRRPPIEGAPTRYFVGHYLDLDVDGGVARDVSGERFTGFGRLRVGVLTWLEEIDHPTSSPIVFSLGGTYGLSSFSPAELGLELEVTHIKSGVWFQSGAAVDLTHPGPVWRIGAGWSVIGVEAQRRMISLDDASRSSAGFVVGAKLRAPVGLLLIALLGK